MEQVTTIPTIVHPFRPQGFVALEDCEGKTIASVDAANTEAGDAFRLSFTDGTWSAFFSFDAYGEGSEIRTAPDGEYDWRELAKAFGFALPADEVTP